MKIAIVFNRDSKSVINLFGVPNQERYGLKAIRRIAEALKRQGHQVTALEGDKDLIARLEEFMPRVLKHERPGMVFNLAYGIQGRARYTHVPSILEMVGIPYVGSGPLAHSLALDKVVAKIIFQRHGLPTPEFAVLENPASPPPALPYPLIAKPKHEAVSFGVRLVRDERELREAAAAIFEKFQQPVLVERFIDGREINVGLLGNAPPEALPPAELDFGPGGPRIYTYEDKSRKSGREVKILCPAPLSPELTQKARELAVRAFSSLGLNDCARVDMRLDAQGNFHILEINSLPSLGEHGSYVQGAKVAGLGFEALLNRLVEAAGARYFGGAKPVRIQTEAANAPSAIFSFLTSGRDRIERRLQEWTAISSRSLDPLGLREAQRELRKLLAEMRMKPVAALSDESSVMTWQTGKGFEGGTILIGHLDVPLPRDVAPQPFRREAEWLFGEGIGCSRAPLVMLEFALRALRRLRVLHNLKLGVSFYCDEGIDCRYSAKLLSAAAAKAGRVLVLRPGNPGDRLVTGRWGQRKYRFAAQGSPRRLDGSFQMTDPLHWLSRRLDRIRALSSPEKKLAVAVVDVDTEAHPQHLPHAVSATLLMSYGEERAADRAEKSMRRILENNGAKGRLELVSDRPPMIRRPSSAALLRTLAEAARRWDIPLNHESSAWPSAGGFAPDSAPVICGLGPVADALYTPREAVSRISLVQRTLLLAQVLAEAARR
ncbi:MAG: ATP-grasp domain-containing protein [Elusimicrobia bacterium]|nr:ATP-grasp domain-containing protein [Elusimicrobiota bacterium]